MTKGKSRFSIELSPDELVNLTAIAYSFGCKSITGPTPDQPSWRVLVRQIANNELSVVPVIARSSDVWLYAKQTSLSTYTIICHLNTDQDNFAIWIQARWPLGTPTGNYYLERLAWKSNNASDQRTLCGMAIKRKQYKNGKLVSEQFPDAVRFELFPVNAQRMEVVVRLDLPELLPAIADLLDAMAERWPELRDNLRFCCSGYEQSTVTIRSAIAQVVSRWKVFEDVKAI